MTMEYREIEGWPGYRVGNDGSVWTKSIRGSHGAKLHYADEWRPLKPTMCKHTGYFMVRLCHRGRHRSVPVHTLVLEAFVGPRPLGMEEGRHLDGDKTNNVFTNLMWGTRSENQADSRLHGTMVLGSRKTHAKLDESIVRQARVRNASGESGARLAAEYGVNARTMNKALCGTTWKHI
jgi:hypothetical protein